MTRLVTALGWLLAVATLVRLRRRLRLVGDAEHELRGAATAIALVAERMPRTKYDRLFRLQLDRMRAGLADLESARSRRGGAAFAEAELRAGRLAQVLGNLIANATEHGVGPIEVGSTRLGEGGVRVEIRNRNRPPQLDGLVRARTGDRGRGLAIAARAANEIGGTLRVESRDGETLAAVELPDSDLPRAA